MEVFQNLLLSRIPVLFQAWKFPVNTFSVIFSKVVIFFESLHSRIGWGDWHNTISIDGSAKFSLIECCKWRCSKSVFALHAFSVFFQYASMYPKVIIGPNIDRSRTHKKKVSQSTSWQTKLPTRGGYLGVSGVPMSAIF